jgi:hypothetical protein
MLMKASRTGVEPIKLCYDTRYFPEKVNQEGWRGKKRSLFPTRRTWSGYLRAGHGEGVAGDGRILKEERLDGAQQDSTITRRSYRFGPHR